MANKKFIGEAIKKVILMEGISQNKFAKKLDLALGNLTTILEHNSTPGGQCFIKLKNEYPEINLDHFFTGEGPLFHDL